MGREGNLDGDVEAKQFVWAGTSLGRLRQYNGHEGGMFKWTWCMVFCQSMCFVGWGITYLIV